MWQGGVVSETQHTNNTMSKLKAKVHQFFATLDGDLHPMVAAAIADKINAKTGLSLTASDIFREYEVWQVSDFQDA